MTPVLVLSQLVDTLVDTTTALTLALALDRLAQAVASCQTLPLLSLVDAAETTLAPALAQLVAAPATTRRHRIVMFC